MPAVCAAHTLYVWAQKSVVSFQDSVANEFLQGKPSICGGNNKHEVLNRSYTSSCVNSCFMNGASIFAFSVMDRSGVERFNEGSLRGLKNLTHL